MTQYDVQVQMTAYLTIDADSELAAEEEAASLVDDILAERSFSVAVEVVS